MTSPEALGGRPAPNHDPFDSFSDNSQFDGVVNSLASGGEVELSPDFKHKLGAEVNEIVKTEKAAEAADNSKPTPERTPQPVNLEKIESIEARVKQLMDGYQERMDNTTDPDEREELQLEAFKAIAAIYTEQVKLLTELIKAKQDIDDQPDDPKPPTHSPENLKEGKGIVTMLYPDGGIITIPAYALPNRTSASTSTSAQTSATSAGTPTSSSGQPTPSASAPGTTIDLRGGSPQTDPTRVQAPLDPRVVRTNQKLAKKPGFLARHKVLAGITSAFLGAAAFFGLGPAAGNANPSIDSVDGNQAPLTETGTASSQDSIENNVNAALAASGETESTLDFNHAYSLPGLYTSDTKPNPTAFGDGYEVMRINNNDPVEFMKYILQVREYAANHVANIPDELRLDADKGITSQIELSERYDSLTDEQYQEVYDHYCQVYENNWRGRIGKFSGLFEQAYVYEKTDSGTIDKENIELGRSVTDEQNIDVIYGTYYDDAGNILGGEDEEITKIKCGGQSGEELEVNQETHQVVNPHEERFEGMQEVNPDTPQPSQQTSTTPGGGTTGGGGDTTGSGGDTTGGGGGTTGDGTVTPPPGDETIPPGDGPGDETTHPGEGGDETHTPTENPSQGENPKPGPSTPTSTPEESSKDETEENDSKKPLGPNETSASSKKEVTAEPTHNDPEIVPETTGNNGGSGTQNSSESGVPTTTVQKGDAAVDSTSELNTQYTGDYSGWEKVQSITEDQGDQVDAPDPDSEADTGSTEADLTDEESAKRDAELGARIAARQNAEGVEG